MRWFHTAVVTLFGVLVIVFAVENAQSVTLSFLGSSITMPMVIQVAIIYVLGMATGTSLWALLRRAVEGAKRTEPAARP